MAPLSVSGQAKTMIVTDQSSQQSPVALTTDTRISFSDDLSKMIVTSGTTDRPLTFDLNGIAVITFNLDSGTDTTLGDPGELQVSNSGGIITISAPGAIEYIVWDTVGHQAAAGRGEQTVTLDFTARTPGVYIIRVNNKTVKFINR